MPDDSYRMFTLERAAHASGPFASSMEKVLPFVIWVQLPPLSGVQERFPCGSPVYMVHPESVGQLYRKMGREDIVKHGHAVCECCGRLS